MNGGNLTNATKIPFIEPIENPHTSPKKTAKPGGSPKSNVNFPITTEDRTMMAPTERSMPAVRMTSDCAQATIPTMATCCSIKVSVNAEKNLSPIKALKITVAANSTIKGTTAGLS